jgi:hypothetical protein
VLSDIVYYLIFASYILFTVNFAPEAGWRQDVGAAQAQWTASRVGGILLIIGVLHGLDLVVMPVLGRLFSLNRRLAPPTSHPYLSLSDERERGA